MVVYIAVSPPRSSRRSKSSVPYPGRAEQRGERERERVSDTWRHSATLSRASSRGSPTTGPRQGARRPRPPLVYFSFGHYRRACRPTSCTASSLDDEEADRPHRTPRIADWAIMPSQKAAHDGLGSAATATAATVACSSADACSTTGPRTPDGRTGKPGPTGLWPLVLGLDWAAVN